MAVIVANTTLTLTVPAGFRLQFGTPISGTATITLPDRILTETLSDGEGLGPYQSDASIAILSTVGSTCYTIRRDGGTATIQSAHLPQVPFLPGVSVFIGESAAAPSVPAGWGGVAYVSSVSGAGKAAVILPSNAASIADALSNSMRAIRQAASHKHCIIVVDSDSTSNGYAGATNPNYPYGANTINAATLIGESLRSAGVHVNRCRWLGLMGQQSLGGSNGLTDPRVSGTYTETISAGVVCGGYQTIAAANKHSYTVDEAVDTAQLVYFTGSGNGTISVDVNGGAARLSVSTSAGTSAVVSAPFSLGALLKPGDVINVNATTAQVLEIGIMCWNSNRPGVTIINNGCSGKTALNGGTGGAINSLSLYSALNTAGTPAALVFWHLILNSLANSSATYQGYLQSFYTAVKAASSTTDIVFYDGPQPTAAYGGGTGINYSTRQADAKYVAAINSIPYISMSDYLGPNPGAASAYYNGEAVGHLTALGYEEFYRGVARPIVDAVKAL